MTERKIVDLGSFYFVPAVVNFMKIPTRMDNTFDKRPSIYSGTLSNNILIDVEENKINFVTTDSCRMSVVTVEGNYKNQVGKYIFSTNDFFRGFYKGWEKKDKKKTFVYDIIFPENSTRDVNFPSWQHLIKNTDGENFIDDIIISYGGDLAVKFMNQRAFNSRFIYEFVKVAEELYDCSQDKLIGRTDKNYKSSHGTLQDPVYFNFTFGEFVMTHLIMPVRD